MLFTDKHKAMLITFLISGTMVLAMFNFHIKQQQDRVAESYYEIETEELTPEEQQELTKEKIKAETNKAYNQNKKSQRLAQAYKIIAPPEDYVRPNFSNSTKISNARKERQMKSSSIEKEDQRSFDKVNDVLKQQQQANNKKSTVHYSLVNREHRFLPTPVYLCETGGKIVINITVNASGKVIDTYYNNASSSNNACLIDHALEYAKKARFNQDNSKTSQIGSITFYFEGKG